jgi:DNA-binding transcriptional MocR family regulator
MNRIHFLNRLAETDAPFNLGAGVPPLDLYPALDINRLVRKFEAEHPQTSLLNYHATEGLIRSLAVEAFATNEGHRSSVDHVMITNGVQEAISLAALHFQGQPIACRDPYYPGLVDAVHMTGNRIEWMHGKHWLDQVALLPERSLLYLSADFANPTGEQINLEERHRLIELAEKRDLYIFDDATYREFHLDERLPALFTLQPERVIHAMSFSKILAPGLRTAMVHLPLSIAADFGKLKANMSLNNSGLTQAVVGGWLHEQKFLLGSHLGLLKDRLRENSAVLRASGGVFSGGFFAQLDLGQPVADFDWCARLLEEKGVAVCPMSLFSEDPDVRNQVRLAVAKISSADLQRALDIILRFVQ